MVYSQGWDEVEVGKKECSDKGVETSLMVIVDLYMDWGWGLEGSGEGCGSWSSLKG